MAALVMMTVKNRKGPFSLFSFVVSEARNFLVPWTKIKTFEKYRQSCSKPKNRQKLKIYKNEKKIDIIPMRKVE